jgi:hypothetical protein
MSLKLNVSVFRKIGQPNYGSLGAGCGLEVELACSAPQEDPEAFRRQVEQAYAACRRAVDEELARNQQGAGDLDGRRRHLDPSRLRATPANVAGNGQSNGQLATWRQVVYLHRLARQIAELGDRGLDTLSKRMFGKPPADLSSLDASVLIDYLKAVQTGDVELDVSLDGPSA